MTPKEKAKKLYQYYFDFVLDDVDYKINTKRCAIRVVEEVISACEYNNADSHNTNWWLEVKQEIENL